MTRKRLGLITVCLLAALGAGGGAMMWGLHQVPDFYERELTARPDPVVRKEAARQLVQRTLHLVDDIKHSDEWAQEFDQEHVNSWLAEELHTKYARVVPKGVSEPRVKFVPDAVLIAFRLEQKNWNGVISLRLRPWVAEPNQLAVEVVSVRAGLVRIPIDHLFEHISRQFEEENYREPGLGKEEAGKLLLHDTTLPPRLPPEEEHEACRSARKLTSYGFLSVCPADPFPAESPSCSHPSHRRRRTSLSRYRGQTASGCTRWHPRRSPP
jgi:hypothetical protein